MVSGNKVLKFDRAEIKIKFASAEIKIKFASAEIKKRLPAFS